MCPNVKWIDGWVKQIARLINYSFSFVEGEEKMEADLSIWHTYVHVKLVNIILNIHLNWI